MAIFLYHLLTLQISPVPWFDETFFASITTSYATIGKFNLGIAPFAYNNELLIYGPLYFWITSFFTKIFTFNIFFFRLAGVLFGFSSLFIFYKVLRLFLKSELSYLIIFAIAIDPIFNTSIHSGRMESAALFFAFVSIFLYFKAASKTFSYPFTLVLFSVSGLAFSLALLTTPRIGVLLPALGIIQLLYIFNTFTWRKVLEITIFGTTLVAVYFLWILYAFKSVHNFINYYSQFKGYVGSSWFNFPKQQILLIILTLISFLVGSFLNYRQFFTKLIILSTFTCLLFYLFVSDSGPYSVIIVPFLYAIMGTTTSLFYSSLKLRNKSIFKISRLTPWILIISFNLLFFTIKAITIYVTSDTRNPQFINAFIKRCIPPGSKVIGEPLYYYSYDLLIPISSTSIILKKTVKGKIFNAKSIITIIYCGQSS